MKRTYSVYCLYNNKSDEIFYVGSTIRPVRVRFREHCRPCRIDTGALKVKELGRENVSYCIIENCDCYDDMFDREFYWTNYYSEFFNLVNKDMGKFHGKSFHEKMDGENNPNYGKHMSDEQKEKLRQWALSHPLSKEDIRKSALARTGIPCSEVRRLAIQKALKEKYANCGREVNRVKVVLINTGEIFNSVNLAAKKYNLHATHISACCRHKRKSTGKLDGIPMVWEYVND